MIGKHPFYAAYYQAKSYLQMDPAQLLVFLCVNVLGVDRRGFAKQLGVSAARLSQYANGVDPVPDKRRKDLLVFAQCAAHFAERGLLEFEDLEGELHSERTRRLVGSVISNVAREVNELAEMVLYDLVERGVYPAEDAA